MAAQIIRSLFSRMLTLIITSIVIFVMVNGAPGDPILNYVSRARLSPERTEQLRSLYGLDRPLTERYVRWVWAALHGDLGESLFTRQPVLSMIRDRIGNTIYLMGIAFVLVLGLSTVLGVYSALKHNTWIDQSISIFAFISQSTPSFWLGIMLVTIGYGLILNPLTGRPLFPSGGMYPIGSSGTVGERIHHLILPLLSLSVPWIASYSRIIRVMVRDVLSQDFVRVARAKGLSESYIIRRHVFKHLAPVLITLIAIDVPQLFVGAYYVEFVFAWPGMGRLFQEAAHQRDYPVLLGISLLVATFVIFGNFIADVFSYLLQPDAPT